MPSMPMQPAVGGVSGPFSPAPQSIAPVRTAAAWQGPRLDWIRECLIRFDDDDVSEIRQALSDLGRESTDTPRLPLSRHQFPLARVARKLKAAGEQIQRGRGFVMLRGLPRDEFTADQMAQIYFGLSVHLGEPMTQSHRGELLGHVLDLNGYADVARAYQDGGHMNMHTDSCDIIGLMCLRTAPAGGASRIASAVAIHDELAERRPDLLERLYQGFVFMRGEKDARLGDGRRFSERPIPVFTPLDDWPHRISCYFLGSYIRNAAKAGASQLSALDLEAIEAVESLAESPEFHLDMAFEDGDIQFLNNRIVFHGRTDYRDAVEIERRRHLLRIWLRAPHWPRLPERQVMHSAEDHRRWLEHRHAEVELPNAYLASLRRAAVPSSAR